MDQELKENSLPQFVKDQVKQGVYLGSTDINGDNGQLNLNNGYKSQTNESVSELNEGGGQTEEERDLEADKAVVEGMLDHDFELDDIQRGYDQQTHVKDEQPLPEAQQEDLLKDHWTAYNKFKKEYSRQQKADEWSYDSTLKKLQEKPIYCSKYNYTLEGEVMNHYSFESKLQISECGKKLVISNRKVDTWPNYIYEKTPDDLRAEQKEVREQIQMGTYQPQEEVQGSKWKEGDKIVNPVHFQEQYYWFQSSCTCNIEDIEAINYGGFSCRFWIFRKHMISMEYDTMKMDNQRPGGRCNFPFFSWQCITLQIAGRTVDLVIKNDEDMTLLLRFLVMALETVDGRRGTVEWYAQAAKHYEIERQEKRLNRKIQKIRDKTPLPDDEEWEDWLHLKFLNEEQKHQIYLDKKKEILRQTVFKYMLMRVRSKISYYAFSNRMTINELFLTQILRTYRELTTSGSIPLIAPYTKESLKFFDDLMNEPNSSQCMKQLFIMAKDPVLRKRKEFIYKKNELKSLGVETIDELEPIRRKQLIKLYEQNLSDEIYERDEALIASSKLNEKNNLELKGEDGEDLTPEEAQKDKSVSQMQGGFGLFDKSSTRDIFLHTKVEGFSMYDVRSAKVMLKFKYDTKVLERKYTKVKFMMGIAGLIDQFYIKCALKKISLLKQIFVLDVEHNLECYIPDELSCDTYPKSFQYYDPIIQVINQLFSVKQKLYHCLKTEFYIKKLQGKDFQKKILEDSGMVTTKKTWKQTFKHKLVNEKETKEVKLVQSKHSQSLQKSRYIMVESTEQGLQKISDLKTYFVEKKWTTGPNERLKNLEDMPLELRYCKDAEVNMKRQKFIVFKQCQFMKHDHLKNQGQKFHTIQLLQKFIEENLDTLYQDRPRDMKYGLAKEIESDRNLDLLPRDTLSGRQKCTLEKDRRRYANYLLEVSEQKVMARRAHIRMKQLAEVYEECGPSVKFQEKNNYVETRLEARFKYLGYMNDLNNKGAETQKIRKELFKLNQAIKENQKTAKKLDPYEVLSSMSTDEKTPEPENQKRGSDISSDF